MVGQNLLHGWMRLNRFGLQPLDSIELSNDVEMAILQEIFHAVRTDNL
jgi:hypothetical protein